MFVGVFFLERVIFTHLFACLFVLNSSLACMLHGCDGSSQAVSDRRGSRQLGDPSRIVTIRQLFQG